MKRSSVKNKPVFLKSFHRLTFPFIAFVVFLVASCSKPAGTIGINIQPDASKLKLKYSDTTTIYAYSKPIEKVRSDNLGWNAIGSLRDPVFGLTNVGFYTQFLLSSTGQEFGEERVLDSLVLQLKYYGIYADTNTVLVAHVYELKERIYHDSVYYSNLTVPVYESDYGNISFVARPNDSVVVGEDTIAPVLRLNLSNINPGLGEKLLAADTSDMEDNETFWNYFQGLYVIAEPAQSSGCVVQFDLSSSMSRLILYYHNSDASDLIFNYPISTSVARVSRYEHDYSVADEEFKQQVINNDTALGTNKFYVQGFGGVNAFIKLPFITKWRKLGNIAINEAKLELNGYETEPLWGAPNQLSLYKVNENGDNTNLTDINEGDSYFGGYYHQSTNSYTFRITRYIQSLINDTTMKSYGLSLYVTSPWVTPNRFIFNGQQADSSAIIKLKIVYTDLN